MKLQLIKKEVYRHMILAKPHVFEITGKNPATPKIKWGDKHHSLTLQVREVGGQMWPIPWGLILAYINCLIQGVQFNTIRKSRAHI